MTAPANRAISRPVTYLDHIRRCNAHDPAAFRPFDIAGRRVGSLRGDWLARLTPFPDVFQVTGHRVTLNPALDRPDCRSDAVRDVLRRLRDDGALPAPRGEDYPVVAEWGDTPAMVLDRAYVSAFGVRAFGLHVNGFQRQGQGLKLWIGRRADDRLVEPGKLDNLVAGGQPVGLTLAENLIKESAEEADIPRALAATARPVGVITYCMDGDLGVKPDTLFVYDLELPADFYPRNTDGEISEFLLMEADEVAERVRSGFDFKFNVSLVLIDFLIRHGHLTPDNTPGYVDLVSGLHPRLTFGPGSGRTSPDQP